MQGDCLWPRAVICVRGCARLPGFAGATWSIAGNEAYGDDAYLDVTHMQIAAGSPQALARVIQRTLQARGRHARVDKFSIGLGPHDTIARYAAVMAATGEVGVIAPWEVRQRLRAAPWIEVFPQASHLKKFLRRRGVFTCGQLAAMSLQNFERHNGGRSLWRLCRGEDVEQSLSCEGLVTMGYEKVLPPHTRGRRVLQAYVRKLCQRLRRDLGRRGQRAAALVLELESGDDGLTRAQHVFTGDEWELLPAAESLLRRLYCGLSVYRLRLRLYGLEHCYGQGELELVAA